MNTRISEHKRCCRLGQGEKSAVAEHVLSHEDHTMRFEEATILSSTLHYRTRLHREAIEIHKHTDNINRKEEGLRLNKAWLPALRHSRVACPVKINDTGQVQVSQVVGRAVDQSETRMSPNVNINTAVCSDELPVAGKQSYVLRPRPRHYH